MNLLAFVDELVKVGAMQCLYKRAADVDNSQAPEGLMRGGAIPPGIRIKPDEASSRTNTSHLPSAIQPGSLGSTSPAKAPIDQERDRRRQWYRGQ
jgi:hypothetical protein